MHHFKSKTSVAYVLSCLYRSYSSRMLSSGDEHKYQVVNTLCLKNSDLQPGALHHFFVVYL